MVKIEPSHDNHLISDFTIHTKALVTYIYIHAHKQQTFDFKAFFVDSTEKPRERWISQETPEERGRERESKG